MCSREVPGRCHQGARLGVLPMEKELSQESKELRSRHAGTSMQVSDQELVCRHFDREGTEKRRLKAGLYRHVL